MEILILSESESLYSTQQLLVESNNLGFNATILNPCQSSSCSKEMFDHVFIRTSGSKLDNFDIYLSQQLARNNNCIYNSPTAHLVLRDKILQNQRLNLLGLPSIPIYSFRGRPSSQNFEEMQKHFLNFKANESFVIKTNTGCQGIGVSLIHGKDSLLSILETFWAMQDQKIHIQPYLDSFEEYRVLVVQEKIIGVLKKDSDSSNFKKNSSRCPSVYIPKKSLPEAAKELALKCAKLLKLSIAGVDIVFYKSNFYILEVNLAPGFEKMDELSGERMASKILQLVLKRT